MNTCTTLFNILCGAIYPHEDELPYHINNYVEEAYEDKRLHAHPLLHEAGEQGSSLGANWILWFAWNNERVKPLFNDPKYTDKYGLRAWQRVKTTYANSCPSSGPNGPDFHKLRLEIIKTYETRTIKD